MITIGFKSKSDGLLRSLFSLALGIVVLIVCIQGKTDPFSILVKVTGCFVIAAGLITLVYALIKKNEKDFPLVMTNACVDLVLGAVLLLLATTIAKVFFYFVAVILIAFAVWEMIVLMSARKFVKVGWIGYVLPLATIIFSILLFSKLDLKVLGYICAISLIVYGVAEFITAWKMRKAIKAFEVTITPEPENADVEPESADAKPEETKVDDQA